MSAPHAVWPAGFPRGAEPIPHQAEGDDIHSYRWHPETMWRPPPTETSGAACSSYGRWVEVMDLLAASGLNISRFGIDWARIEFSHGVVDESAMERHRRMVAGARARRLQPVVNLHLLTLPECVAARGEQAGPKTRSATVAHVRRVAPLLHGVTAAVAIDEPDMVAVMHRGHTSRGAPGHRDQRRTPATGSTGLCCTREHASGHDGAPTTTTGWQLHSQTIAEADDHARSSLPDIDLLIGENGIATADDRRRIEFIDVALLALRVGRRVGASLCGYLHRSLLDDFEGGSGRPRSGLLAVNRDLEGPPRPLPFLAHLGASARAAVDQATHIEENHDR